MTIIRPKLATQFDYDETFFYGLQVTVSEVADQKETKQASVLPLLDQSEANGSPTGSRQSEGRIFKRFWLSDSRKKPVDKDWELSYVVQQLQQIVEFGEISAPKIVDHGSFEVTNERPEDAFVTMQGGWVYWNEWRYQPLYKTGKYLSLPPIVTALADIQKYIEEN
jgi:hypothetical protein